MGIRGPKSLWLHPETTVIRVPTVLAPGLIETARERDRSMVKAEIDALRGEIRTLKQELAALTPSKSQEKKRARALRTRSKSK